MTEPPYDPNEHVTVKKTATILDISMRSVWRLIAEKKLRARRFRGATRIKRKDIEDFSDES